MTLEKQAAFHIFKRSSTGNRAKMVKLVRAADGCILMVKIGTDQDSKGQDRGFIFVRDLA